MNNMKLRAIRKLRVVNHLINNGFNFIECRADYKFPGRYVWMFEVTPEFQKCVDDYYASITTNN